MAWYSEAARKNIPPGPNDPPIKPRVVILHVAASEATSLYPYFNGPSGGVESHFYIRYDGTVEQYRDTSRQADANVMANDFAISVETQGLANGTWTAAQLAAIKALLTWCHNTHGIPLVVCPKWDGSGVGYHILFEAQWDQRHASCPGPNRIQQFKDVLVPWMAAGGSEVDVEQSDVQDIWTGYGVVKNVTASNPDTAARVAPSFLLELAAKNSVTTVAQLASLTAAVKTLAESKSVDPAAVLAAVKESADAGVKAALADLNITLSTQES